MGQISIYSLPTFRRQILFNCIKPTDIVALSSFQFTPFAHAFYLQSSSEFTEVTFSPEMSLSSVMKLSYDKFQRKTIVRSVEDSISSTPPKKIAPVKPEHHNENHSNSDSAIDLDSMNTTNQHPST